jgi:hypothetical protein
LICKRPASDPEPLSGLQKTVNLTSVADSAVPGPARPPSWESAGWLILIGCHLGLSACWTSSVLFTGAEADGRLKV